MAQVRRHKEIGKMSKIVHFDVAAAGYNKEAAGKIEQVSIVGSKAAYNTDNNISTATRTSYLSQEADRLTKIIDGYTVKIVLAVELSNGLGEYARLDKDGKVISTYWDVIPEAERSVF
jgi:hypothetical protein